MLSSRLSSIVESHLKLRRQRFLSKNTPIVSEICISLFLFVLRAVTKAADYLEAAEYNTGNPNADLKTESLIKQLLYNPKLQVACPVPFDEAKFWKGQSGPDLKRKIQHQLRNIRALAIWHSCKPDINNCSSNQLDLMQGFRTQFLRAMSVASISRVDSNL
ncbi:unnamed protein product [Trifolium pratense]|uniref:Uncharacterized protein n=1 Tax=Trifolium pratense TaxID=57577 RepID=A0ACB0JM30_TRIPR|nr:unnamed protein product [Trifolium pratense]